MPNVIEASLIAEGKKFVIVVSRFNDFISAKLLDGALDALQRSGAAVLRLMISMSLRCPALLKFPLLPKKWLP